MRTFVVWAAVAFSSAIAGAQADLAKAELRLEVLLVNDPDFPRVTVTQAEKILEEARATLTDKLSFSNVVFEIKATASVRQFLNRNVPEGDPCMAQFEKSRVRPGTRQAVDVDRKAVGRFLARWKLPELQAFFPEKQQRRLTSYEKITDALLQELDRKHALIASFELEGGKSLLAPDRIDERSYVRWICAIRNQDEADLVLTNAFILYDLGSEPYPHTVFQKSKVGGASLLSTKRRAIRKRAVVASTFSMVTDLPFYKEEGVDTLSAEERLAVIGTFIVAHELGHAVFKIPDFYDHPRECLMTTKYETGYVSGFKDIKQYPGHCPKCQPYVEAKRHLFSAHALHRAGKVVEAIAEVKNAIRKTPKHIDGSYLRYVADLSVLIAELFAEAGNDKQAKRWLGSALRIVPNHTEAKALEASLAR